MTMCLHMSVDHSVPEGWTEGLLVPEMSHHRETHVLADGLSCRQVEATTALWCSGCKAQGTM